MNNKLFLLHKLRSKKLKLYKNEINPSVLSCHSAANLKYTPLKFFIFCITQLGTTRDTDSIADSQLDTRNWTHNFRHTHSYEKAVVPREKS
jgi:hypothetical protein